MLLKLQSIFKIEDIVISLSSPGNQYLFELSLKSLHDSHYPAIKCGNRYCLSLRLLMLITLVIAHMRNSSWRGDVVYCIIIIVLNAAITLMFHQSSKVFCWGLENLPEEFDLKWQLIQFCWWICKVVNISTCATDCMILHQSSFLLFRYRFLILFLILLNIFHIFIIFVLTLIHFERCSGLESCPLIVLYLRIGVIFIWHSLLVAFHVLVIVASFTTSSRAWSIWALFGWMSLTVSKLVVCSPFILNEALHITDELNFIFPLGKSCGKLSWLVTKNGCYATFKNHLNFNLSGSSITLCFLTDTLVVVVRPLLLILPVLNLKSQRLVGRSQS